MSKTNAAPKKTVKIKESQLVDVIENLLTEAIAIKKQDWINEQAKISKDKTALLESKLASLEAKINKITEGRK
jgi:gas vesicle protein